MSTLSLKKKVGWSSPHVEKENERNTVTNLYFSVIRLDDYVTRMEELVGREREGERDIERDTEWLVEL